MPSFRHVVRTYAWFAIAGFAVVLAVVLGPVLWQVLGLVIGFIIAPVFIILNVYRGQYVDASLLAVLYAIFLLVIYNNIDKILYAIAWVRVVVGDLVGGGTRPSAEASEGGYVMSDDNSLERRREMPLGRVTGNPLDTLAQSIQARLATKTTEEVTKAVRAKTDLYTAHTHLGQAMLTHDDTAVEVEPDNREQRRENKQADLDIKTIERKIAVNEAEKKLKAAKANDTELFERKRDLRSIDARDDAFEDLGFAASKKLELGREYVKRKKEIQDDRTLDDEVRQDLLSELEQDYKDALAKANGNKARTQNASG